MVVLYQMIKLLILMCVGFAARKCDMITDETSKKMSGIVLNISNPCFILSSLLSDRELISKVLLLQIALIAGIYFCFLMLAAVVLPKLLKVPKASANVYRIMLVFSNVGFVGFPIISGIYGNYVLMYGAIFQLYLNILIYTYGILLMGSGNQKFRVSQLKSLCNPGVLSVIITLLIYLTDLRLPSILADSVQMLGNLTVPLCMMIIGASFTQMSIRKELSNIRLLVFTVIKMFLIPLLAALILKVFIQNEMVITICTVAFATPVASVVPILAQQYGSDEKSAVSGVALTAFLSVFSIPFLLFLVR